LLQTDNTMGNGDHLDEEDDFSEYRKSLRSYAEHHNLKNTEVIMSENHNQNLFLKKSSRINLSESMSEDFERKSLKKSKIHNKDDVIDDS
jgi:hypothetical protein